MDNKRGHPRRGRSDLCGNVKFTVATPGCRSPLRKPPMILTQIATCTPSDAHVVCGMHEQAWKESFASEYRYPSDAISEWVHLLGDGRNIVLLAIHKERESRSYDAV